MRAWIPPREEYSVPAGTADFGQFLGEFFLAEGFHDVIVLLDYQSYGEGERQTLLNSIMEKSITIQAFELRDEGGRRSFLSTMETMKQKMFGSHGLLFVSRDQRLSTSLLEMHITALITKIREKDLIRRGYLYVFPDLLETEMEGYRLVIEPMRIVFLRRAFLASSQGGTDASSPRLLVDVYYNQACARPCPRPVKVNDWSLNGGFRFLPPLPRPEDVYRNLQGRTFRLPVIYSPPWYRYQLADNGSVVNPGGRDHAAVVVLAQALNFTWVLFQNETTRGSTFENGTFSGVLGRIMGRDYEWFLDDTTQTEERNMAVEFSFPTLDDADGFIFKAPPPQDPGFFQVSGIPVPGWTLLLAAGLAITLAHAGLQWAAGERGDVGWKAFFAAYGGSLQQNDVPVPRGNPGRVLMVFFFSYALVMGTLINASLVSLYTNPGKVRTMETLEDLNEALGPGNARAIVVPGSSTFGLLSISKSNPFGALDPDTSASRKQEDHVFPGVVCEETMKYRFQKYWGLMPIETRCVGDLSTSYFGKGSGVYASIYYKMQRQTGGYSVDSIEKGIEAVCSAPVRLPTVFIEGRKALDYYHDRVNRVNGSGGREFLHLNEEIFFTKYKGIAMQWGSAYLPAFNQMILRLWQSGIIFKLTHDEFTRVEEGFAGKNGEGEEGKRKPLTLKQMTGSFAVFGAGLSVAGTFL
ncbi:unnamed protein product [Darwinula stevensoni]|uniref:Uncharacterized protein n=1 Tax=Darwinula stevensoni TaxID=69355 RepID=A0A7R9ABY7_9CRUS|nr:unnamed protein product [Darwinula stevensoni]CAG0899710.1 unnamed protein product [Darwinula stevensoni]